MQSYCNEIPSLEYSCLGYSRSPFPERNEKSKANSRCTIEYLFSCKLCEISKYFILKLLHGVSKEHFFPICFPCTLSARDARGVYVCLASVYPVIRDRCPCPSKTVGPTPRFGRRPWVRSCIPFRSLHPHRPSSLPLSPCPILPVSFRA